MSLGVREFRDDDAGYLAWVALHPDGFVLNIQRALASSDARSHRASCRTISGQNPRGGPWTGPYIKVCADELPQLERWTQDRVRGSVARCRVCLPSDGRNDRPPAASSGGSGFRVSCGHAAPPPAVGRSVVRGPSADRAVVEAWSDDYIRFERRPPWQGALRTEIREGLACLSANPTESLSAVFFGTKPARADVENLVLYNVDGSGGSFASAARFGVRFELATRAPPPPDLTTYAYAYRYELAPSVKPLEHWRERRTLASWDWVDLGSLTVAKRVEQVWLALRRASLEHADAPRATDAPFAVRLTLRPPAGMGATLATLIKPLFDGTICALQAHTDRSTVADLASRLSRTLHAPPQEIQALLTDETRAVLGSARRLLHARGAGVAWAPADDLCHAGEILAAHARGSTWQIAGKVTELIPA
jgi:hypothetical protein